MVEKEIVEAFSEMTEEVQNETIQQWTIRTYNWLNKARVYVKSSESLMSKMAGTAANNLLEKQFKNVLVRKRVAKDALMNQSLMTEGYVLLNQIGESLRGEEILYSVTITKTGKALSSGMSGTGGVYTWKVPLSEFLKMINFTSRRMTLKSSSSLYKMLQQKINKGEVVPGEYEEWTEQKLQSYSLFTGQIRSYKQWSKVNEGNILEAFLRYTKDYGTPMFSKSNDYWRGVYNSMFNTMKSPDKFFVGGDIDNEQIKGLNASVTNLNSLILNIEKLWNILKVNPNTQNIISNYYKKSAKSSINKEIEKSQNEVVDNLLKFFTSNITR